MGALWSAATVKLVGAGIDDAKLAEDLSRLVGEHDVPVGSLTRDGSGLASWQTSTRRQRVLEPAQIRALDKGTALLLATGIPVALVRCRRSRISPAGRAGAQVIQCPRASPSG
jgi:type IV secretory pathway TraG/TraD family ATPase VirD4